MSPLTKQITESQERRVEVRDAVGAVIVKRKVRKGLVEKTNSVIVW